MPDYLGPTSSSTSGVSSPYTGDYGFTTSSEIERYLGSIGVELATDDLTSNTQAMEDAILDAEDFMLQYLLNRYEPVQLQGVTWMTRRATQVATFFLLHRRGNTPSEGLTNSFLRIESELEKIAENPRIMIPGAIPRQAPVPVMSNHTVDNRRIHDRGVVQPDTTTSSYSGQRRLRHRPGMTYPFY